jgi:hypothetical protein
MFRRGSIVVASDPYGHTPRRPYLILSDEAHPFAGEQYIAAGITTKEYLPSISLRDGSSKAASRSNRLCLRGLSFRFASRISNAQWQSSSKP